jgi:hypothetical protein
VTDHLGPVSAFNDLQGKALLYNPPQIDVIQVAGIIYGGISGGPLLDGRGNVIGVLSGSLAQGGNFGWAIPADQIQSLLSAPPRERPFGRTPAWDDVPFVSKDPTGNRLRSTEYFVRRDETLAAIANTFTTTKNRLRAVNQELATAYGGTHWQLSSTRISIDVLLTGTRLPGLPPLTVAELNMSPNLSFDVVMFAQLRADLTRLQRELSERYNLDAKLRSLTARLSDVGDRSNLDEMSARKARNIVGKILSNNALVATDSFERIQAVDKDRLIHSLARITAKTGLTFSSLSEAASFASDLRIAYEELGKYRNMNFMNWTSKEDAFFESADKFLRNYFGLVVYVPE